MAFIIKSNLPNPTYQTDSTWSIFSDYLKQNGINQVMNSLAVNAYQNASNGGYLCACELNHCINFERFGIGSDYAIIASNNYGNDITDYNYKKSLDELDALFTQQPYRFTNSFVYKGIDDNEPFYHFLNLPQSTISDVIVFPGFLSTTVCRHKAESFARGNPRILLEFINIDCADAIIPPNMRVQNSPTPSIPEQEVLLNRGASFKVVGVRTVRCIRVIQLEAIEA